MTCYDAKLDTRFEKLSGIHPCFSGGANMTRGRVHLPVSPSCNIQCKFCRRRLNKIEQRPGVTNQVLSPAQAADLVDKALQLCPEITVAGVAGPGDALATTHALKTFQLVHQRHPELINCLSTNGLMLERYAQDILDAGVQTVTVTVNAVDPEVLQNICSYVVLDGQRLEGLEGAKILIEAQQRGIRKAAELGAIVKVNIVLIPGVNDFHIAETTATVAGLGAAIINIIPLIPQHEMAFMNVPTCEELNQARGEAEKFLPVFRHCQHCRADACGIPGQGDLSGLLYGELGRTAETFSHG